MTSVELANVSLAPADPIAPTALRSTTEAAASSTISELTPPRYGMTLLALAFCGGITLGWHHAQPLAWLWLVISAAMLLICFICWRVRLGWAAHIALLCSATAFGGGWVKIHQHHAATNDVALHIGDEPLLVRASGVALGQPVVRARTAGSMARFDYRQPGTYFPMRIESLSDHGGAAIAVVGSALVRVDETIAGFRAGDRVEVTGYLLRPSAPANPGEFDYRQHARSLGQAGMITVPSRDLMKAHPPNRGAIAAAFLNWRDELRRRASAWLLTNLPAATGGGGHRDSLLMRLMLGEGDPQIDGLDESFRRVGLAHILAISGFHLGVLAGFVLLIGRSINLPRALQGMLVIAVVLTYLLLVETRMPVLRAGAMSIAASLGLLFGRRLRLGGLVAFSAIMLLLWRPDQLFNAGFQLTFAVVLGLIYVVPNVRRRWFGAPKHSTATSAQMIGHWLRTAVAISSVAWMVATPITAYHFGVVTPIGVALSVIAVPIAAVILALGFSKMVLAVILPSASMLLGVPLAITADVMLAIVGVFDGWSMASLKVPHPSAAWSLVALAAVCGWGLNRSYRLRRAYWVALAIVAAWLVLPLLPVFAQSSPALRIDMLAVGDGSCIVLRSGGHTFMFDAGSSSDLDAGRRSVIPALRRLGLRSIDCLAISHPDLDHYSAVLEVASEFGVDRVLVTPQLFNEVQRDELGPLGELLRGLTDRECLVMAVAEGHEQQIGRAKLQWLWPQEEGRYRRGNDGSMVIRVEAGGRSTLLTGDIEREAMAILMAGGRDLKADVAELPHHGGYSDVAEAFVLRRVQPAVVMQSTGWIRLKTDKWSAALKDCTRLITARDGASWVEIDDEGRITSGGYLTGRR